MDTWVNKLDNGQLDMMWSFLQLKKECTLNKEDVKEFKETLDSIRTMLVQKTAGQREGDKGKGSEDFQDLETYINIAICQALELYIYGGLDILENSLPTEGDTK